MASQLSVADLIVDTSCYVSYHLKNDANHSKALAFFEKTNTVTKHCNEFVISELATVLLLKTKRVGYSASIAEALVANTHAFSNYFSHQDLVLETLRIFKTQSSNKLSFTDCSLIAQARLQKIKTIATFDKDLKKQFGSQFDFITI